MTKSVGRSAKTGRFVANRQAAAKAYIAVASKRHQPIPDEVKKIAGGTRENGKGRGSIARPTSS